jgi:hypothetical protein
MQNLSQDARKFLTSLNTPSKIQDYLESIPFNHEKSGETCMPPIRVLQEKKAHCMEGAILASLCLMLQKREPLILSLRVLSSDYDHVLALYKENGYWGAISKTNHAVLGFRDPIYKTVRELALSYFHEYFLLTTGEKTLRGYSRPMNLKRFGSTWVSSDVDLFEIAEAIYDMPHKTIIPDGNEKFIRTATLLDRKAASITAKKK